jgi:UDP-2,3-diacylglucosamine pyrophosphatase LpxH
LNWARRRLGLGYWSLSAFLKHRVKTAVNFIGEFEDSLADVARRSDVDGVICGHIHHAANRRMGGVHYLNCGDWVESCTALVETMSGEMQILYWNEVIKERAAQPAPARAIPAAA